MSQTAAKSRAETVRDERERSSEREVSVFPVNVQRGAEGFKAPRDVLQASG